MNRKSLIAFALAALAGAPVLADDIGADTTPFISTATRAQVQSQLAVSRQSGVQPGAEHFNPYAQFRSQRSRAQATAEYLAERDRVAAFGGEDSGSAWLRAYGPSIQRDTLAGQPAAGQ